MRNALTLIIVSVAVVVLSASLQGQQRKGGGANTLVPVTAVFRCPMTIDCQTAEGIEGDSIGPYRGTLPNGGTTTPEGTAENNGSYLITNNNWFLFVLKSGLGRFVSFDLSQPVGVAPCGSTCKRTFTRTTTDESLPGGRVAPVDAAGIDLSNGLMSIPIGGTSRGRLYLNFPDPDHRSLLWTVRFDPALHPGSSFLSITRTDVDAWTIEATQSHVAGLTSATTSGKNVKVNEGYFRMPFRIAVTR